MHTYIFIHQGSKRKYLGKIGVVVIVQDELKSVRLMHEETVGAKMVWWALGAVKMEKEAGAKCQGDGNSGSTFKQNYPEEQDDEDTGAIGDDVPILVYSLSFFSLCLLLLLSLARSLARAHSLSINVRH